MTEQPQQQDVPQDTPAPQWELTAAVLNARPSDTPAPELPPCWNCGAAPRLRAGSMLCGSCGGGGVA